MLAVLEIFEKFFVLYSMYIVSTLTLRTYRVYWLYDSSTVWKPWSCKLDSSSHAICLSHLDHSGKPGCYNQSSPLSITHYKLNLQVYIVCAG